MAKNGGILNVTSVNGVTPGATKGIYSITKAFARGCAPQKVRADALLPGATDIRFASTLFHNPAVLKQALSRIPMQRVAEPSEIAGAVLFCVRRRQLPHRCGAICRRRSLGIGSQCDRRAGCLPWPVAKGICHFKKGARGLTWEELQLFLKTRLGKHEMAQALEVRAELPKTPVGKLSKKELYAEEERKYATRQKRES